MITVFSLPQDRFRVEPIIDALIDADLAPWWEHADLANSDGKKVIAKANDARCLIFCWSADALATTPSAEAFRAFAVESCARQRAIGVLIDPVGPPSGFACTCYDLTGWRARPTGWRKYLIGNAFLRDIVAAAKSKQSGRDPPPPSAPRKLMLRELATLLPPILLLGGVFGFWNDFSSFFGLDNIASAAEDKAWDALPPGDCAALRSFIRQFDEGVYRDRAEARLQAAETRVETQWQPIEIPVELYLPHLAASDEAAARSSAEASAQHESARRCEAIAQTSGLRLLDSRIAMLRQNCQTIAEKNLCDWRGESICLLEEPVEFETQICETD